MDTSEIYEGGCSCGVVRYQTTGKPERVGVCTVDIVKPEQVVLLVFRSISTM